MRRIQPAQATVTSRRGVRYGIFLSVAVSAGIPHPGSDGSCLPRAVDCGAAAERHHQ